MALQCRLILKQATMTALESPLAKYQRFEKDKADSIAIECNDGHDSGYAGVNPLVMWNSILEIEKAE